MPNDQHSNAWPADSLLVFSDANAPRSAGASAAGGGGDLLMVNPLSADAAPHAYLAAQWAESEAAISPDGRFAAYTSAESGALEVYVRPFPAPGAGGQWKISAGGGYRARWSPDGRTILYQALDGRTIRAAHVTPGSAFAVLSREDVLTIPGLGSAWDVDRRTGRIVVSQTVGSASARIIVIVNWLERLRRGSVSAP